VRKDAFAKPAEIVVHRVQDLIDGASYFVISTLMAFMSAIIVVQVVLRYIFNGSIDWADEAARLSFVWIVFLAVPHAVKFGLHVGLDVVVKLMTPRVAAWVAVINRMAMAAFLVVVGWQATALAYRNWHNEMSTLPLPQGLFFAAVAIGSFHSLLHLIPSSRCHAPPKEVV
jgi:TRAP-type C4-dicarboxylate transport system permease small subunit